MSIDKDKTEKSKNSAHAKTMPKEAQVIASILKEQQCDSYDPRVINQLLDYSYRYCTGVLHDAKHFAQHSQKKTIEFEDIRLAMNYADANTVQTPLSRVQLAKLSEQRNSMPLPQIKPHCGLRLPPDRYAQLVTNYRMKDKEAKKQLIGAKNVTGNKGHKGGNASVGSSSIKRMFTGAPKTNTPKLKLQQQQQVLQQPPLVIQTHPTTELKSDMDVESAVGATLVASSIVIDNMEH